MIARDIIISFCIFSVLKYDRTIRKNLEHDTYVVKKAFDPALRGGLVTDLASEIYFSFGFLWHI